MRTKIIKIFLPLLIIVAGTALRMQDFTSLWTSDHRGWSGSYYGNIARNYIEHGYVETKFGAVQNVDPRDPAEFDYYVNHPPLLGLLISVSFHVFGIHEWAVRLVPLLASVISMWVILLIARRLWGESVGLFALAAFAVMPMGVFFGALADVQGPLVLLFCLLLLYYYLKFRERPSAGNLALMCAAFVLGALTDWPAFYLPPLLALHYYAWRPRARRSHLVLVPLVLALVLGAAYLPYSNWLLGAEPLDVTTLAGQFLWRSDGDSADSPAEGGFTTGDWLARVVRSYWAIYLGYPMLFFLAVWTAVVAVRILRGSAESGDGVYLLALVFALLHIVIFRQGAYVHAYWSYYMLVPAAFACGLCLKGAVDHIPGRREVRMTAGIVVMALTAAFAIFILHHLWQHLSDTIDSQIAIEIDERCEGEGPILTDLYYRQGLFFYLHRPICGARLSPVNLAAIADDPDVGYVYINEADPADRPLYQFLATTECNRWTSPRGANSSGILIRREDIPRNYRSALAAPKILSVEKKEDGVLVRWEHPDPAKVEYYMLYWRSSREGHYSNFFEVGKSTEKLLPATGDEEFTVAVVAVGTVDGVRQESNCDYEIHLPLRK